MLTLLCEAGATQRASELFFVPRWQKAVLRPYMADEADLPCPQTYKLDMAGLGENQLLAASPAFAKTALTECQKQCYPVYLLPSKPPIIRRRRQAVRQGKGQDPLSRPYNNLQARRLEPTQTG